MTSSAWIEDYFYEVTQWDESYKHRGKVFGIGVHHGLCWDGPDGPDDDSALGWSIYKSDMMEEDDDGYLVPTKLPLNWIGM